jgi:hypothetical protein
VAFIVTVKLVEKSWKSKVGTDMVVSLRLQYRMVERACMTKSMILPINPSQEDGGAAATTSLACNAAVLAAAVANSSEEDMLSEEAMMLLESGKLEQSAS